MHNLFNPENPGMRFLSRIFDLIVLNAIFMITCLPIVTIGAALSSLYHITILMVRNEDGYIVKGYFKSFKQNFGQATLLWIPLLFILAFFGTDLYIVLNVIDASYKLLQIPIWIILFLLVSIAIYAFPLLSNFESTTKQVIKNAVLISLANIPSTIFFIVFPLGILYIATKSAAILIFLFSIILFCGLSLLAFINSLFLNRIFERCMQSDENPDSDEAQNPDNWSLPDESAFVSEEIKSAEQAKPETSDQTNLAE